MGFYKKYGVYGMNEFVALIRCGRANVSIVFRNGSNSIGRTVPATYATKSEFFQAVIEQSDLFKGGRIQLLDCVEVDDEPSSVASASEGDLEAASLQGDALEGRSHDKSEDHEPADGRSDEEGKENGGLKEIEVSCLADAKDYLCNEFGYKKTQLKGAESVKRAAEEHGVMFVGSLE